MTQLMYLTAVPNRNSPPAILRAHPSAMGQGPHATPRQSDLMGAGADRGPAPRPTGEFDGLTGTCNLLWPSVAVLFVLKQLAERVGCSGAGTGAGRSPVMC